MNSNTNNDTNSTNTCINIRDFLDFREKSESSFSKLEEKIKKIFKEKCQLGKYEDVCTILRRNKKEHFLDKETITEGFKLACKSNESLVMVSFLRPTRILDINAVRKGFKTLCCLKNADTVSLLCLLNSGLINRTTCEEGFKLACQFCKNRFFISRLLKLDDFIEVKYVDEDGFEDVDLLDLKIDDGVVEEMFEKEKNPMILYEICYQRRVSRKIFFKKLKESYTTKNDEMMKALCSSWWASEQKYDLPTKMDTIKYFFSKGSKIGGTDHSDNPPPVNELVRLVEDEIQEEEKKDEIQEQEEKLLQEQQRKNDEEHRKNVIEQVGEEEYQENDQLSSEIEQEVIDEVNEENSEEEESEEEVNYNFNCY